MDLPLFETGAALWLGLLTSVAPCPLATNIAAVSFIGKRVESSRTVVLAGMLYTLGRVLGYVALAAVIVLGASSLQSVFHFAQKYMNKVLGPVLILVGMLLLDLISLDWAVSMDGEKMQARAERWGRVAPLLLGVLFALAFCPTTAIYYGKLIHSALAERSVLLLPGAYGIGTAIPVLVFAVLIARGGHYVGAAYNKLTVIERWARRLTGAVFLLVGVYYCLVFIYGIPVPWMSAG